MLPAFTAAIFDANLLDRGIISKTNRGSRVRREVVDDAGRSGHSGSELSAARPVSIREFADVSARSEYAGIRRRLNVPQLLPIAEEHSVHRGDVFELLPEVEADLAYFENTDNILLYYRLSSRI
jgi:hypothetical protein